MSSLRLINLQLRGRAGWNYRLEFVNSRLEFVNSRLEIVNSRLEFVNSRLEIVNSRLEFVNSSLVAIRGACACTYRGAGTGPADPATAGPMLKQLATVTTDTHRDQVGQD